MGRFIVQKQNKKLKKLIYRDCRETMTSTAILYSIEECLSGLVMIYAAGILGEFADAVFTFNISFGIDILFKLLVCIGSMVLIIPMVGLIGEVTMFVNSLTHDRTIFDRFFDKGYEQATEIEAGEVQYRLENDPITFRCNWVDIVTKAIITPIAFIYVMYEAIQISWIFTLITFVISATKLVVPLTVKKLDAKYDRQTHDYNVKIRTYESQIVEQPHMIKMYGLREPFLKEIDEIYHVYFKNVQSRSIKCKAIASQILSFLDTFCLLIILLIGAIMVANNNISPGAVVAMTGYFTIFNLIISNTDSIIRNIPILKNNVDRLLVIYQDAEDLSGEDIVEIDTISARSLKFTYDDKEIFNHLDFHIKKGDKVAICGPNGSGKTTLIKMICRLLKNYGGSLQINQQEIKSISISSWYKQIAYAEQNPYLFSGTVLENVRLGNKNISEEMLKCIMEEVGIMHLSTREVSMDQNNLSGGEKQKISIARALAKNTPIIILDEPHNNLDSESLSWLEKFIKTTDKTVLFISHEDKLSTLANNRIIL